MAGSDPQAEGKRVLEGTDIVLSGEYSSMKQTFRNLAIGLALAVTLIYFMMVALKNRSSRRSACCWPRR